MTRIAFRIVLKRRHLLLLTPLAFWSCGGGTECGEGTMEAGGVCVPSQVPPACGAGTTLQNGVCVPDGGPLIKCGPGTMLVDGECRPDGSTVVCAMGTMLDNGQCIPSQDACGQGTTLDATGICIPDVAILCGTGTAPDANGVCVPDPNQICQPGTTYDPNTGSCAPDVACQPGEVAVGGVCLTPEEVDASNADVTEGDPDMNDPNFGGTPEALPTPDIGDSTIFVGQIGEPVDLDGDNSPDQDWDYFAFDASAGDTFEIVLRSLGNASLGFVVTGPNGYRRQSPLYFQLNPSRHVVLPYDGQYQIAIAPQLSIEDLAATPIGGGGFEYVAVLEHEPFPTATDLALGATQTGNFLDLTNNLYQVRVAADQLVRLEIPSAGRDASPLLLLFDGQGNFVSQLDALPIQGLVHRAAQTDDLMVLFDWDRLIGDNDGYEIVSVEVIPGDVGQLPADGTLTSSTATIAAGNTGYFQATVEPSKVLEFQVTGGAAPNLRVIAPDGALVAQELGARATRVFAAIGGRYTVEVENTAAADDGFQVTFTSISPVEIGPLAATASTSSVGVWQQALGGGERAYFTVETSGPARLDINGLQDTNVNLSLFVHNLLFETLRAVQNDNAPSTFAFVPMAGRIIVELVNEGFQNAQNVGVEVLPADLPPLEMEPNDGAQTATPLATDTPTFGEINNNDQDFFRITLAQDLGANELLEIRASEDTNFDDYTCELQNSTGTVLEAQTPRAQGCLIIADGLVAGDYLFTIQKDGAAVRLYQVNAQVITGVRESEPNDQAPGNVLADLTGVTPMFGEVASAADADVFNFDLLADLPAGQLLRVTVEEIGTRPTGTMQANLQGPGGLNVNFAVAPVGVIGQTNLPAGTYQVQISRTSNTLDFDGHYRITVGTEAVVIDTEPNNDFMTAQALGPLPAQATGDMPPPTTMDDDFYSFQLAADLLPNETLVVRMFRTSGNPSDSLRVTLYDSTQTQIVASQVNDPREIPLTGLTAGTYYVRADSTFNTTFDTDYLITVAIE